MEAAGRISYVLWSGKLELTEDCILHGMDFSDLLLLYSSLGDAQGISKLEEQGKNNVAFLRLFMLGNLEERIQLLLDSERILEAALMARSHLPSMVSEIVQFGEMTWTMPNFQSFSSVYEYLFPVLLLYDSTAQESDTTKSHTTEESDITESHARAVFCLDVPPLLSSFINVPNQLHLLSFIFYFWTVIAYVFSNSILVKIGRQVPVASMDRSGKLNWAKHNEIQIVNIKSVGSHFEITDGERLPLAVKELGNCDLFPQASIFDESLIQLIMMPL